MYHSGKGYVGVGKVISAWSEEEKKEIKKEIHEGKDRLLYTKEGVCEYRIKVEWYRDFRDNPKKNNGWPSHPVGYWKTITTINLEKCQELDSYVKLDSASSPSNDEKELSRSIETVSLRDSNDVMEERASDVRSTPTVSLFDHEQKFEQSIAASRLDSSDVRRKRLANAQTLPRRLTVVTTVYERNPDVVTEVLMRANGICELCKQPAPFNRKKDDSPYLEVHHIQQLSRGGLDIVSNAQALCPNCHRKAHYGIE